MAKEDTEYLNKVEGNAFSGEVEVNIGDVIANIL